MRGCVQCVPCVCRGSHLVCLRASVGSELTAVIRAAYARMCTMRVSRLTSCPLACVRKRVPQLDDLVQCAACACVSRLRRRGVVFCTSDVVSNKRFCGMLIQIHAGAYRCGRLFGCGGVRDFLCLAVHTARIMTSHGHGQADVESERVNLMPCAAGYVSLPASKRAFCAMLCESWRERGQELARIDSSSP